MDLIAALANTFDHAHAVIAGVQPDQLDNQTPCAEWNVGALLGHTIGVVQGIGNAVAGRPPSDPAAFVLADDPAAQFRSAANAALAAWTTAGLDGEQNIGAGPMPGGVAIGINLLDTSTHSWDIARATGQPEQLPADLAEVVLGLCHNIVTDDVRGIAGFDPAIEVANDADATTRLVAFLGRRP